jgi:hypothetical protein
MGEPTLALRLTPLLTIAALATPVPAMAGQALAPAVIVAGAPKMASKAVLQPQTRPSYRPIRLRATPRILPFQADFGLKKDEPVPEVEVPAKDEWFDDQGLRIGPTKIAYKKRF